MGEKLSAAQRCPVCEETAPEPKWFCLYRLEGVAKHGEPCDYSIEGNARMEAALSVRRALDAAGE